MGKLNYTKRMSDEAARKGNQKLVKSINRSIVLNIVREHGPVSRADVSRLSQFYPATVSSIVNDLISEGFVREAGLGDSTGGRPETPPAISSASFFSQRPKRLERFTPPCPGTRRWRRRRRTAASLKSSATTPRAFSARRSAPPATPAGPPLCAGPGPST